ERVEALVGEPEVGHEARPQGLGVGAHPARQVLVAPDPLGQARGAYASVVRVPLNLTGRVRVAGERPVRMDDRIPGVLPALVDQAAVRVAGLVREVPVPAEV